MMQPNNQSQLEADMTISRDLACCPLLNILADPLAYSLMDG